MDIVDNAGPEKDHDVGRVSLALKGSLLHTASIVVVVSEVVAE